MINVDWLTIVLSDTKAGGSEHQQLQLFRHLYHKGEMCYAICLTKRTAGYWDFLGNNVTYFPFSRRLLKINFCLLFPYLVYFFIRYKVKYVFSTQTLINSIVGIIKKIGLLYDTKVILRESNSIFQLMSGRKLGLYKLAYQIGYSKADLLICQTQFMKNQLLKFLPKLESKVRIAVLDNPIEVITIQSESKPEKFPPLFLVAAGSLHPKKGFDILIDACQIIMNEKPQFKLLILGEGSERANLEERISRLGLERNIELLGYVENVYPYFKYAKCCVISSRIEGFPNVLLQMMSQNTTVVSTLCAGGIEDIPGLFTVPVNNPQALTRTILNALIEETSSNRVQFDNFLKARSVEAYVNQITHLLSK